MIGHSFLMDANGFLYISEYCYYYIAGYSDRAWTCITIDDIGEQVKPLVEEVYHHQNNVKEECSAFF